MKIHQVTVITRNPNGPSDVGSCEVGFFKIDNDMLMLVDSGGSPLRTRTGNLITHELAVGEEARRVASRLTLTHWRAERDASGGVPGFNDPLRYTEPYGGY